MTFKKLVSEILDLLQDGRNLTHAAYARNAQDRKICPLSEEAVSFCVSGAMLRVLGYRTIYDVKMNRDANNLYEKLKFAIESRTGKDFVDFSDNFSVDTVFSILHDIYHSAD